MLDVIMLVFVMLDALAVEDGLKFEAKRKKKQYLR
jgi:hypothetical protein